LERLPDVQELLDSLKAQTYPDLEIIFVGEGTRELSDKVRSYGEEREMANLWVLFNEGTPGLSPARNLGVRHARGDIIAFIDDHAVAPHNWAAEIIASFAQNPSAIGVTGQALPLWEDESMSWFPDEFYWMITCTLPTNRTQTFPVRNAWGVNMAFRREVFELCQFSESFGVSNRGTVEGTKLGLVGDDTEFGVRVSSVSRRPILFSPGVKVLNKVRLHKLAPRFTRRRAFWEGYTKATLRRLHNHSGEMRGFPLSSEYAVLRRIAFPFLPKVLGQFLVSPVTAWWRLSLAVGVVLHVFLGYLAGSFSWPGRFIVRRYSR